MKLLYTDINGLNAAFIVSNSTEYKNNYVMAQPVENYSFEK